MITGKGIYAWRLERCENGNMVEVVSTLKRAGMTHIIPKIADGSYEYTRNTPYLNDLIDLAHHEDIQVIPYQFVYGTYPESEAGRAIKELKKYPYDGFVIDAESAYKNLSNSDSAAKQYCDTLRKAYPDLPLCLSTFRFPSYHRGFPFETFLKYCDYNMPQVYWMQANGTVVRQLDQTIQEYAELTSIPMIPTGAAFGEYGWTAIPSDQVVFIKEVQKYGLQGCNWWEYWETFHRLPELGQAIINTPFEAGEPPDEPEVPEDIMYVIEMLGHLRIRKGPGTNYDQYTDKYALRGETHHSTKRAPDEGDLGGYWYEITAHGVTGWIYGGQWTRITEVEPEPDPEPEPPMTLEERVAQNEADIARLKGEVFG